MSKARLTATEDRMDKYLEDEVKLWRKLEKVHLRLEKRSAELTAQEVKRKLHWWLHIATNKLLRQEVVRKGHSLL